MIVTLSGITGTGKSFFKDAISKELNFKNLAIVTTRNKRKNEVNGIDKEFVSEEEFEKLVKNKEVVVDFEFLGAKYGYRKEKLESSENQVTEVHYSTIYEIKKHTPNIFSIYIIPKDIERAKIELKNRELPSEVIKKRLQEIDKVILYNTTSKGGITAFNLEGIFSQDTALYLDHYNICVRAGNHCAKVLKEEINIKNTCRISLYFYNTKEEIDKLIDALKNSEDLYKIVL